MSIQSGINQLLGMTALMSQLPGGQEFAESQKLKREAKVNEKQFNKLVEQHEAMENAEGASGSEVELTPAEKMTNDAIIEKEREIRKRQFELNPSIKTAESYLSSKNDLKTSAEYEAEQNPQQAEQKAEQSWQNQAKQQIKQKQKRRNFMNYLKDFPVNWGGTLGDYPLKVQQMAAQQYTKAERKRIMDEADRKKENKR